MNDNNNKIINKIKIELEKIKLKLAKDGGSIEFINFKNGILKVRLLGECENCSISHLTMKYAIEPVIKDKIPEVTKIININLKII